MVHFYIKFQLYYSKNKKILTEYHLMYLFFIFNNTVKLENRPTTAVYPKSLPVAPCVHNCISKIHPESFSFVIGKLIIILQCEIKL